MLPIQDIPSEMVDEFFEWFTYEMLRRARAGNLIGQDAIALQKWFKESVPFRAYMLGKIANLSDKLIDPQQAIRGAFAAGFMLAEFVQKKSTEGTKK